MTRRPLLLATAAALVAVGGCAHRVAPAPSAAIAEVRERLSEPANPAHSCDASPATFEAVAPFAYADAELTEEGRATLQALADWLGCHADAAVAITVAKEPHYRRPEQEEALRKDRLATAMAWLHDAGIAEARIHLVAATQGAAPETADAAKLTLRGRGW